MKNRRHTGIYHLESRRLELYHSGGTSKEDEMEAGQAQNSVNNPEIGELLDEILDAVLALKARLGNSNRDSNSLGGTNYSSG